MAPSLTKIEEIIHTLIYLDEYNQLKMQAEEYTTQEGENVKTIKLSMTALDMYLEEWYDKKKVLENNEITQDDYYEWKINWPDSSKKYREIFPEIH